MFPSDMDDSGIAWIIMFAICFGVGFLLSKMKLLSDANIAKFCTWTSGIIAALVALAADTSSAGMLASSFGRIGIFIIVWFVAGIILTIGVSMGVEKSEK